MKELEKIINIGPKAAEKLDLVGVNTLEQLNEIGSRDTFIRLRYLDPTT